MRKKNSSIFTVIVEEHHFCELSTVSFEDYNDAVKYVMKETTKKFESRTERNKFRNELKEYNYIDDGNLKFYIEEAQLVHKKD